MSVLNKHPDYYDSILPEHLWFTSMSANANKHLLAASAEYVLEMLMFSFQKTQSNLYVTNPRDPHTWWSMASQSIEIIYSDARRPVTDTTGGECA